MIAKINVFDKIFIGLPRSANIKAEIPYKSKVCQVNVFDKNKMPFVSESIGMNIKDFKLTCQKNSFLELKMDFNKVVKEITGLPQNLALYNDCIKGVIQTSGEYLGSVHIRENMI